MPVEISETSPMNNSVKHKNWLIRRSHIFALAALLTTVGCGGGSDGSGSSGEGSAVNAPLTGSLFARTRFASTLVRLDAATGITTFSLSEDSELREDKIQSTRLSADGTRLYISYDSCITFTDCIIITDLDGHELNRIFPVDEQGSFARPVFVGDGRESPDGRLLLAIAGRRAVTGSELLVMDTDGTVLARHLENDSIYANAQWLPDGRIVYRSFSPDQIRIIDDPLVSTDGTHRVAFEFRPGELHGTDINPSGFFDGIAVNPVTGEIAFPWNGQEQDNDRESFDVRVYIVDPDDGRPREIARGTNSSGFSRAYRDLLYSPDGRWMSALVTLGDPAFSRQLLVALDTQTDRPIEADEVVDSLPEGMIHLLTDCSGSINEFPSTVIICGNSEIGLTGSLTLVDWR